MRFNAVISHIDVFITCNSSVTGRPLGEGVEAVVETERLRRTKQFHRPVVDDARRQLHLRVGQVDELDGEVVSRLQAHLRAITRQHAASAVLSIQAPRTVQTLKSYSNNQLATKVIIVKIFTV